MARDVSFMQYMRAHGNTPSPTQKPMTTAIISGLIAAIPFLGLLYWTGAIRSVAAGFGTTRMLVLVIALVLSVLGAIAYSWIFKRAANDRSGGWLFGMSVGFLLWMLGPVALWQTITGQPVAVGTPAMGIFGAYIFYGLVLGFIFPWTHFWIRGRLSDTAIRDEVHKEKVKEEEYGRQS